MALNTQTSLGGYEFVGPYTRNEHLPAVSGVYLVTTLAENGRHTIIDVGESRDVRTRISGHDRTSQWRQNVQNGLYAWVLAAGEAERMLIEKAHRVAYSPICGER